MSTTRRSGIRPGARRSTFSANTIETAAMPPACTTRSVVQPNRKPASGPNVSRRYTYSPPVDVHARGQFGIDEGAQQCHSAAQAPGREYQCG